MKNLKTKLPVDGGIVDDKIYVLLPTGHEVNLGPLLEFLDSDYPENHDLNFQRTIKLITECMSVLPRDEYEWMFTHSTESFRLLYGLKDALQVLGTSAASNSETETD